MNQWIYTAAGESLPSQRALYIRILVALRGAVAGSVVLSNVVIVLTSLWQRAREECHQRIQLGKEPPFGAGARVHTDVTELALQKLGPSKIWPIFEDSN